MLNCYYGPLVKRPKTPPFHGGNSGSNPLWVTTEAGGRKSYFGLLFQNIQIGLSASGGIIDRFEASRSEAFLLSASGGIIDRFEASRSEAMGNLVYGNTAARCGFDGILLDYGSTNNRIIKSVVRRNSNNGIETYLSPDRDNAIIDNISSGNDSDGFEIFGDNNLLYRNKAYNNAEQGIYSVSENMVGAGNETIFNHDAGIGIYYNNVIALNNEVKGNTNSGIQVLSSLNIIEKNEAEHNRENSIVLGANEGLNAVIRNEVEDNKPYDINDLGSDNNFVENECESSNPPGLCAH